MWFVSYLYCPRGGFLFSLREVDIQQVQLKQGVSLSEYMCNCSDPNTKPQNPNPSVGAAQGDWIWKALLGPQWPRGFHSGVRNSLQSTRFNNFYSWIFFLSPLPVDSPSYWRRQPMRFHHQKPNHPGVHSSLKQWLEAQAVVGALPSHLLLWHFS